MLHSLPALLDELERRLMAGEDPMPLLGSVRWSEVIDWPRNWHEAARLQATLLGLHQNAAYKARGSVDLPSTISLRIQDCV